MKLSQLIILSGCATSCASGITGSIDQSGAPARAMRADIITCTDQLGYPPRDQSLGEHELAPREISWRECAYQAIRNYITAGGSMADSLRQLIDEDRRMTAEIPRGPMTRAERSARLGKMIADIQMGALQEQQADQVRRTLETFRH